MITQQTAADIWHCYREIEAGKQLLKDIEKVEKENLGYKHEQHLKDAFGYRRNLQLGIPMGDNVHQLLNVAPKLALSVIRAHIAEKEQNLIEVNERARIELYPEQREKEANTAGVSEDTYDAKISISKPVDTRPATIKSEPPGPGVL